MRRAVAILSHTTITLALLATAGCSSDPTTGYATTSTFPTSVSSVAVPIFANDTFTRSIEDDLTDAVIKQIETRTPYQVTTRTRADTILIGRVRKVELDQLSKSNLTGLGEEVIVGVTIDFEWRLLDQDKTLVERNSFEGNGLFVPSTPTGERIELGRMAAVQDLARAIVDEMQAAW